MCDESQKPVTIYDLAKLTDASPSTVSAVLNGSWRNRRISEKLAARIFRVAEAEGYSLNMQARALRRDQSGIIGMLLPLYDNRYFSSIAQVFESEARKRGLFAIVSCTNRDPVQEQEAARRMLSYRVEKLICTGCTEPDSIARMCQTSGVPSYNLDLPGNLAPSIISANREGARQLTEVILQRAPESPPPAPLFIGGRPTDHNTKERIRGFKEALSARGIAINEANILPCGYAGDKAQEALQHYLARKHPFPREIFVNSTITLDGIAHWFREHHQPLNRTIIGCFDWDPLAAVFNPNLIMVRQNVEKMIAQLFAFFDSPPTNHQQLIEIPPDILGRENAA